MHRYRIFSILFAVLLTLTAVALSGADEIKPDRPDIVVKIHRIGQTLDLIDKMAGADSSQPTALPSFFVRSVLFGTDWIDPNRPIIFAVDYSSMDVRCPTENGGIGAVYTKEITIFICRIMRYPKSTIIWYRCHRAAANRFRIRWHFAMAEAARENIKRTGGHRNRRKPAVDKSRYPAPENGSRAGCQGKGRSKYIPGSAAEPATGTTQTPSGKNPLYRKTNRHVFTGHGSFSISTEWSFPMRWHTRTLIWQPSSPEVRPAVFSRMAGYGPNQDINFKSVSYNINGMLDFFNTLFGEFYKTIGIDLAETQTMAAHFTGEMAGGITLNDAGMDMEMIAVLNETKKNRSGFSPVRLSAVGHGLWPANGRALQSADTATQNPEYFFQNT